MSKHAICLICLRSGIQLRKVADKYSSFHDELCDYMLDMEAQFCWYCEHQLKKAFSFRRMCRNALKVMKNQKKLKAHDKAPLNRLYELVPPIPLGQSSKDKNAEYHFIEGQQLTPLSKMLTIDGTIVNVDSNVISDDSIRSHEIVTDSLAIPTTVPQKGTSFDDVTPSAFHNSEDQGTVKVEVHSSTDNINERKDNVRTANVNTCDPIKLDVGECNIKQEYNEEEMPEQEITQINIKMLENDTIKLEDENQDEITNEMVEAADNELESLRDNELNSDDDTDSSNEICDSLIDDAVPDDSYNSDESSDQSVTLINYNDITNSPVAEELKVAKRVVGKRRKPHVSREKVRSVLEEKLALWGEIKGRDGMAFDKNQILDAVENKLKNYQIKVLWSRIRDRNDKPPKKLIDMFEFIHKQFYKNDYESMFDIEYLNTDEKKREEFDRRKTYNYYLRAEHKCELCYARIATEHFLDLHNRKYHSEASGNLTCSICPQRFKTNLLLKYHMSFWHNVVYKCKLCDAVIYMKKRWISHYDRHKGIVYTCTKCDRKFKEVVNYWSHMTTRHAADSARVQTCRHCACVFVAPSALTKHMKRHHKSQIGVEIVGGEDAKCKECDIVFVSNEVYKKHWTISHLKGPNKGLGISSTRAVPCKLCNKLGSHLSWLKTHYQLEHPEANVDVEYADRKPYLCDVCGNRYATIYALNEHRGSTHSTEPRFECQICSEKFVSKFLYNKHRKAHDNITESHSCPECGKTFAYLANMRRHKRSHGGVRKYKCLMCPKDFLYQDSLKAHVMSVHNHIRKPRIRKRTNVPRRATKRARVDTESDCE